MPEKWKIIHHKAKTFQYRYNIVKPHVGVWLGLKIPLFAFTDQNMACFDVLPIPSILRCCSFSGLLIYTNHNICMKTKQPVYTCAFIKRGHVWRAGVTALSVIRCKHGFAYSNCWLNFLNIFPCCRPLFRRIYQFCSLFVEKPGFLISILTKLWFLTTFPLSWIVYIYKHGMCVNAQQDPLFITTLHQLSC